MSNSFELDCFTERWTMSELQCMSFASKQDPNFLVEFSVELTNNGAIKVMVTSCTNVYDDGNFFRLEAIVTSPDGVYKTYWNRAKLYVHAIKDKSKDRPGSFACPEGRVALFHDAMI